MKLGTLDGAVAFLAVAKKRSFTAAAAELGVTRSAVSQTIKSLETKLGVALLARTTRDVGLTEAGQRLYEHLEPALGSVAVALEHLHDYRGKPSGLLRLNVPRIAVDSLIASMLPGFLELHPNIQIEIYVDDSLANIVDSGFDAGIRLGEMVARDMVSIRLTPPSRLLVLGAPALIARHGMPQTPEELTNYPCINYRQITRGGIYKWEFQRDGEEFEVNVAGPVITNDTDFMLRAGVNGLGFVYQLESIVRPFIETGALKPVLEPFALSTPGLHIYFPARSQVLPKLRAFIDYLKKTEMPG